MAGKLCAIVETVNIIGTKPRLTILRFLEPYTEKNNGMGFNELKRACELSSRTLALNLKFLSQKGIIESKKHMNKNLYCLSKKGSELKPILDEIGDWGIKWHMFNTKK